MHGPADPQQRASSPDPMPGSPMPGSPMARVDDVWRRFTPVQIAGVAGLDGAWALGSNGSNGLGELLDRARARPMGRATVRLGVDLAAVLATRPWPDDLVVVPVPSERGTSDVLARVIGHVLERDVERLVTTRWGQRRAAPSQRFSAAARYPSDHVLLVDDVIRTGETLAACAQVLRDRGVFNVWAVAAAVEAVEAVEAATEDVAAGVVAASEAAVGDELVAMVDDDLSIRRWRRSGRRQSSRLSTIR